MNGLPDDTKKHLTEDFKAQVFAFRKLRERLLMSDNPARIYEKISVGMPSANSSINMSKAELEQYLMEAKAAAQKNKPVKRLSVEKNKTIVTLTQDQLEAQLRSLRRKEYYNKRVKRDFAPGVDNSSSDEYDFGDEDSPDSPTGKKRALSKEKEATDKKKGNKEKKDWNMFFNKDEKKA